MMLARDRVQYLTVAEINWNQFQKLLGIILKRQSERY